ncbi:MAG: YggS family pyridoxal phosphate-dependent enzyme [Planctomycetaceae bacterium]|jgi:pyridoxal phosphate enzyme (YggS family)|nr:YggS family pyridoxal phosphate-dependent enzyme [Planctomycetaceae bacterium]
MTFQSDINRRVAENAAYVRERIAAAAQRCGRAENDVALVAVSKYASCDDGFIEALLATGCNELGENRTQVLLEKNERFKNVNWHFIGSLQRNKVRKVLSYVTLFHSIDSLSLAEAFDRISEEENIVSVRALLEVNISGDKTKHGFTPQELEANIEHFNKFPRLQIVGLMCMSGLESNEKETRQEFRNTAKLAKQITKNAPANVTLKELSMGMSDDYEIAIEEGATIVRVGARLMQ